MNTGRIGFSGAFALLMATAGQAQNVDEEVVVIGTRGEARSALDSPVPVDVITATELEQVPSFGGELGEVLQSLAPSFNFPRQSNSGSADHVRAAQLRGMNPDQVLVLVNGKRQHTSAVVNLESKIGLGTTPFDFNTIALGSIERIEILRDGAAAQYGSDAIAGVVNIVLKDAPGEGGLHASYGLHQTDFDPTGDSITDGQTFYVAGDHGIALAGGSLHFGAEYRQRSSTNRAGIGDLPFFEDQTPANQALDPARVFAPGDGEAEDVYLFYNATLPLGAAEFYSFGRYSYRDAEGAAFFRYPDGFSGVPAVYPNGYRPVTTGENNDFSISNGLNGSVADWGWDLSLTVGRNDYEFGVENSINPSFGTASPTEFDLAGFEFLQNTLNADLVHAFDVGAFTGPLTFAWGAELRYETYETTAGDPMSYEAGPLAANAAVGAEAGPGLDAESVVDTNRFVYGLYASVEAEVARGLELGLAARYEDYDDFGDALTGKFTAIYHFNDSFALRGSAGTNFRAPSLAQTGFEFSTQDFGPGGQLVVFGHLPVSDPVAIANGATPLEEEEAENYTLGLIVTVGDLFDVTVDHFRIDVDDRITLVQGSVDNVTFFTNLVNTRTEGFDVVATGDRSWGASTLGWQIAYNTSDTEVKNPGVLGEEELNTIETAPPDDKLILGLDWRFGRWSVVTRAIRYGETSRDFDFGGGFPDAQVYGEAWQLDLELGADITGRWSVALGAENLFDEYPDLSSADNNFFNHLPYDVLPPIGMNGAFYYLRSDYRF